MKIGVMTMRVLLAVATVLLAFSIAGAEMYQWVDENGAVTFKDTPPPASKKKKKVKVYRDNDFAPAPPPQPVSAKPTGKSAAAQVAQPAPSPQVHFTGTVELYVTSWCGYCKRAQSYLKSKGVPYVAYDIEQDSAARQRHKDLGGHGVPLIIIGSHKMNGFSPEEMDYYLNNGR
ncbi:glutaredoxin domain-containing protein [Geobacter sp. AOG2]|uniref:glutaredoxin domain-containing protein n=1 Tax=Geobacter sp. AOG2 TaxID=1566347 RepID=UPI001CC6544D|nr:glutaredoxin domain-containing protein [Geobacter sp. AOG2]GFE62825.1 NrdH-like redox domain-containing protein [Geobacter sp. AOG2]